MSLLRYGSARMNQGSSSLSQLGPTWHRCLNTYACARLTMYPMQDNSAERAGDGERNVAASHACMVTRLLPLLWEEPTHL